MFECGLTVEDSDQQENDNSNEMGQQREPFFLHRGNIKEKNR
jgi:hypothetical protein